MTEVVIPILGLIAALTLALAVLGISAYAIHLGHTLEGIGGVVGMLASIILAMKWGRRS